MTTRFVVLVLALAGCKHGGVDKDGCPDDAYHHDGYPGYCLALPPGFQKFNSWQEPDSEVFAHLMSGNDKSILGGDVEVFEVRWSRDAGAGPKLLRDLGQGQDLVVTMLHQTPSFAVARAMSVVGQTSAVRHFAAAWVPGSDGETITCSYSSRVAQMNPGEEPPDEPTNAAVCQTLRATASPP